MVGLFSGGDKSAYRDEIQRREERCSKQMIDAEPSSIHLHVVCVERVDIFRFLGSVISEDLTWTPKNSLTAFALPENPQDKQPACHQGCMKSPRSPPACCHHQFTLPSQSHKHHEGFHTPAHLLLELFPSGRRSSKTHIQIQKQLLLKHFFFKLNPPQLVFKHLHKLLPPDLLSQLLDPVVDPWLDRETCFNLISIPESYTGPRISFPLSVSDTNALLAAFKEHQVTNATLNSSNSAGNF